jgi:hypothetical protein
MECTPVGDFVTLAFDWYAGKTGLCVDQHISNSGIGHNISLQCTYSFSAVNHSGSFGASSNAGLTCNQVANDASGSFSFTLDCDSGEPRLRYIQVGTEIIITWRFSTKECGPFRLADAYIESVTSSLSRTALRLPDGMGGCTCIESPTLANWESFWRNVEITDP